MKKAFLPLILLALLLPAGSAWADPVQEFGFQLKNITRDGRFTVVFTSRSYDSTGSIPPLLTENYTRLPTSLKFQSRFITKRYFCDAEQLQATLADASEPDVRYLKRILDVGATLERIRNRISAKAAANMTVCARAKVGVGRVIVDARPFLGDPIPSDFVMFLSAPTEKGGIASFGIIAVPDPDSAVVKATPLLQTLRPLVRANFFNDPTPDGLYGYKLVLPSGPVAGVRISLAELTATVKGLTETKTKRTCTKHRKGKCIKHKVKKTTLFWATAPKCPASGKLNFEAFYKYETGLTATKTIELACPSFPG